jgi:transketolase C-terminal domain/subunit
MAAAAQKTNNLVLTVEDHYAQGGLGDAVAQICMIFQREGPRAAAPGA